MMPRYSAHKAQHALNEAPAQTATTTPPADKPKSKKAIVVTLVIVVILAAVGLYAFTQK
jgi:flagellar basal body-associated protein FliL